VKVCFPNRKVNGSLQPDRWAQTVTMRVPDLHASVARLDESIGDDLRARLRRQVGWMIELLANDVSVNVVFLGGAEFESAPPRATAARSRYVKVTLEKAREAEMYQRIEQAGRVPGLEVNVQEAGASRSGCGLRPQEARAGC
jgi:hypothetical protein